MQHGSSSSYAGVTATDGTPGDVAAAQTALLLGCKFMGLSSSMKYYSVALGTATTSARHQN